MENPRKKRAADTQAASIAADFPAGLAKPALRALYAAGLRKREDLRTVTEEELRALHGMGPKAITALRRGMSRHGISFRDS